MQLMMSFHKPSLINNPPKNNEHFKFLSHMSHELRTPLNAIIGFSEMMEISNSDKYSSDIRENAQLLLHRINDMMEVAGASMQKNSIYDAKYPIIDSINDAINICSAEISLSDIKINISNIEDGGYLKADRAKISRAIGSILSNAIRFSEKHTTINISSSITANGFCFIKIKDKGCGISSNYLKMIQKELANKNSVIFSNNPEELCIGLGLYMARGFIDMHDGDINIMSNKGEGTEVTILLPPERVFSVYSAIDNLQKINNLC